MVTIPNAERRYRYNPVAATTDFPVLDEDGNAAPIFDLADVAVYRAGVLVTTGYTVTGTFTDGFCIDAKVIASPGWTGVVDIVCLRAPRRADQFQDGRGVPAKDQNAALNRLSAESREHYDRLGRAIIAKPGDAVPELTSERTTGRVLGFDADGNLAALPNSAADAAIEAAAAQAAAQAAIAVSSVLADVSASYTPAVNLANLQAAIDGAAWNTDSIDADPTGGGTVVFTGQIQINAPVKVKSGVTLTARNKSDRLIEAEGFTGTSVVEVCPVSLVPVKPRVTMAAITGFTVSAPTKQAVGYAAGTVLILNGAVSNMIFDAPDGLIWSGVYAQRNAIDNVISIGGASRIVEISGNFNVLANIDKEGGAGTGADGYVSIVKSVSAHGTYRSRGNVIRQTLAQQTTSATKASIKLEECDLTDIDGLWYEPGVGVGNPVELVNCQNTKIRGSVRATTPVKIRTSFGTIVDALELAYAEGETTASHLDMDAVSDLYIGRLLSWRGSNAWPVNLLGGNVRVGSIVNYSLGAAAPAGLSPISERRAARGGNLFKDPAFLAGVSKWTIWGCALLSTGPSRAGNGRMAAFQANTAIAQVYQNLVVTADQAGMPHTLTITVRMSGSAAPATAWLHPFISGGGIVATSAYERVYDGAGDCVMSMTFIPQAAGTVNVGLRTSGADAGTQFEITDACLSRGGHAENGGAEQFSILGLGDAAMALTAASAAPAATGLRAGHLALKDNPADTSDVLGYRFNGTTVDTLYPSPVKIIGPSAVTYDPPSLAAGASALATVTVAGAVVGDAVIGVSFNQTFTNYTSFVWTALVSAANTVTVKVRNDSGSTVDPPSGTLRVLVAKLT